MTGRWPNGDIDHIDGDRLNNKWSNLREVTRLDNRRNAGLRVDNTSGYNGISYNNRERKWETYIEVEGQRKRLGKYLELHEAIQARKRAEKKYGFHPNHGGREGWRA